MFLFFWFLKTNQNQKVFLEGIAVTKVSAEPAPYTRASHTTVSDTTEVIMHHHTSPNDKNST